MDLVWDRPTLFFQAVKRYFRGNKKTEDYKKMIPVEKDEELGKLVHNLFENSYHYRQHSLTYSTQSVEDFGLQLAKENNGKEKAVLSRLWRIDLEPMSHYLELFFNKTPDLYFDSPELDGEKEIAQAHVWIGYDWVGDGIKSKEFQLPPKRKFQGMEVNDYRISFQDSSKILKVLEGKGVTLNASQIFGKKISLDKYPHLKEGTILPVTYKNKFGLQDHRLLFPCYSIISIKGEPVKVRKTVLNLLAACSNETEKGLSGIDKTKAIKLDLAWCLSSHHLLYHQWKPQEPRGC